METPAKKSFKDIHDVGTNGDFADKTAYTTFCMLLDHFFGKHTGTIIINSSIESESNAKFIDDNWNSFRITFGIPSTVRHAKKYVRQTIKRMVDYFNNNPRFTLDREITFYAESKTARNGSKSWTSINTTTLII